MWPSCQPHRWDALASIGAVAGSLVTIAVSGGVMTRSEDLVTQLVTQVMAGGEDGGVSGGVSLGQRLSQGDGDQGGQGQQ